MTSKTIDPDAVEINRLYREAGGDDFMRMFEKGAKAPYKAKQGTVTRTRHFSGRMSGSHNATNDPNKYPEGTFGWLMSQPSSGDVCYYCRQQFSPDQMRYRTMHSVPGGWGPTLLCMDCFKSETDESCLGYGASRHVIECAGCGEQINTIRNPRYRQWNYCSNRCYQRVYRKRRRGLASVVEWKAHPPRCKCCRKSFKPPRTDALYCSPSCRQWMHRRRVWANQGRNSPPRKRVRKAVKIARTLTEGAK